MPYNTKEKARVRNQRYYRANHERELTRSRNYYRAHPETAKAWWRKRQAWEKESAFAAYSNGPICCACCGETNLVFLSIDHIDGGGNKHRREIHTNGGTKLYQWLRQKFYPPGYRVLCMNCNHATRFRQACPHTAMLQQRAKERRGLA
mgnify:FL=1